MAGLASSQEMEDVGEPDFSNGEQEDENSMAFSPAEGPTTHHCQGGWGNWIPPKLWTGLFSTYKHRHIQTNTHTYTHYCHLPYNQTTAEKDYGWSIRYTPWCTCALPVPVDYGWLTLQKGLTLSSCWLYLIFWLIYLQLPPVTVFSCCILAGCWEKVGWFNVFASETVISNDLTKSFTLVVYCVEHHCAIFTKSCDLQESVMLVSPASSHPCFVNDVVLFCSLLLFVFFV